MKKWLKLNYKYYVIAFVIILTCMIRNVFEYNYLNFQMFDEKYPIELTILNAVDNVSGAYGQFMVSYPILLIVGFIILHGIMLWGQRNKSEREFLETIPIKRESIIRYRVIMDVLTMVSAVVITCIVTYVYLYDWTEENGLYIPWLGSSIAGLGISLCSYMIFALGIMYFLESVVVRGDLKIISTAGCIAMFYYSMNWLYEEALFGEGNIFYKVVGFIKMYSVGGNHCIIEAGSGVWGPEVYWLPKEMFFDVSFLGQKYEFSTYTDGGRWYYVTEKLVGFSQAEHYISYVVAYIAIGTLLIALAVNLTKKQDLAKQSFYFNFAPVMIGFLIFVTVFTFFFVQIPEYWYSCILMGLIAFVGFLYLTSGKRRVKI